MITQTNDQDLIKMLLADLELSFDSDISETAILIYQRYIFVNGTQGMRLAISDYPVEQVDFLRKILFRFSDIAAPDLLRNLKEDLQERSR
jgi:hypothetical protein